MPDFVALGKFNKVHRQTFKVKLDYYKKEAQELLLFADSAGAFSHICLSLFVCTDVETCAFVASGFKAFGPFSVGMHPCNC